MNHRGLSSVLAQNNLRIFVIKIHCELILLHYIYNLLTNLFNSILGNPVNITHVLILDERHHKVDAFRIAMPN